MERVGNSLILYSEGLVECCEIVVEIYKFFKEVGSYSAAIYLKTEAGDSQQHSFQ